MNTKSVDQSCLNKNFTISSVPSHVGSFQLLSFHLIPPSQKGPWLWIRKLKVHNIHFYFVPLIYITLLCILFLKQEVFTVT